MYMRTRTYCSFAYRAFSRDRRQDAGPQFAEKEDDSPLLDAKGINEIQQKVGSAYYYGRAIDSTIIPSLTSISAEQSQATERTKRDVNKLFDYLSVFPPSRRFNNPSVMAVAIADVPFSST